MSLTFQEEPVRACWDEAYQLARLHAEGTQGYRRSEPFNPKLERYEACEQMGMYHLLTARDGPRLAGYFGVYLTDSMHSQLPILVEDTFFLHPDYRKGRNAIRFIQFIEAWARAHQVQEILFSCEIDNPTINVLLGHLAYKPVIVQYSKRLASLPPGLTASPPARLSDVRTEPPSCS